MNTDVVLLCGGMGSRLQSVVNDRPKPMAEIGGRPFLDILMDYVGSFGFRRFILCTGYMGENIRRHYQGKDSPVEVLLSREDKPLGTAGAIKNAQSLIKSREFLVMNGDCFCRFDLNLFLDFHIHKKALITIALVKKKKTADVGVVSLDAAQRITGFSEKKGDPASVGLINTGTYIFNQEVLSSIPLGTSYSLEYDLFPKLDNCYGYVTQSNLIDIGTPVGYATAKKLLS